MDHEKEQPESLPQNLIKALRSADRAIPVVTARVDREIEQSARAHFLSRKLPVWHSRPAWVGVAAVLMVAIIVVGTRIPVTSEQPELYADVDGSGRIDIADVMALARAGENADVSQDDIDAFAMRIVALNRNGDSS